MQVLESVGPAWEHTKRFLFKPFSIGRWFSLGVIFFIAALLEGGGGSINNLRMPSSSSSGGASSPIVEAADALRNIGEFFSDNPMGIPVVIAGVIVVVGFALLLTWLGTRGELMAFRAVGMSNDGIGDNWRAVAPQSGSLFRVHILLGAIAMVINIPLVVFALVFYVNLVDSGITSPRDIFVQLLPFISVLLFLGLIFGVVTALLRNFVVPMMVAFGVNAREGIRIASTMAKGNWGAIILFFFLRIAFGFFVGILGSILVLCTCCIGGLPVLNQVLMAPWLVFERSMTLHFIETAGPEYRMVLPPPEPAPYAYPYYPPYPPY